MTAYLAPADARHIAGRFGFHVRDVGLLESAVARPAATVMGADAYPELELKAAALLESLARNHPLVDGNKRTSWTLMVMFLWLNGYRHDFTTDEGFELIIGVASGALALEAAAGIIARHTVLRSPGE